MTTPAQPIPITAANRDKIPFPCWLYGALTQAGLTGRCDWYHAADKWYISSHGWTTHYLPDQPDRPTCVPEGAAPAPASATTAPSATLEQMAREACIEFAKRHAEFTIGDIVELMDDITRHFAGWVGPEQAKQHAEELQQVAEAFKMPFAPGRDVIQAAKDIVAERDAYAADWQKVVKVALACDPIPACERADNNLEPPWIVFERVRAERDDLKRRVEETSKSVVIWHDGYPTDFHKKEWFLARTKQNGIAVLTALPEEYAYDFKTADDTYLKKENVVRWAQFPTSEYRTPLEDAEKTITALRAELTAARKELDDTSASLTEWMQCAQRRADKLAELRAERDDLKRQVEELNREVSGQADAAIEMTGLAQKYHARLTAADEQVRVLREAIKSAKGVAGGALMNFSPKYNPNGIALLKEAIEELDAALATQPKEDRK